MIALPKPPTKIHALDGTTIKIGENGEPLPVQDFVVHCAPGWHPGEFTQEEALEEVVSNLSVATMLDALRVMGFRERDYSKLLDVLRLHQRSYALKRLMHVIQDDPQPLHGVDDAFDQTYAVISAYLTLTSEKRQDREPSAVNPATGRRYSDIADFRTPMIMPDDLRPKEDK